MINNFICENCLFQNKCVARTKLKPFMEEARTDLGVEITINKCEDYSDMNEENENEDETKDEETDE